MSVAIAVKIAGFIDNILYVKIKILTSSTTGSTYISMVLLSGGSSMGDAAHEERRDALLHEH